MRRGRLKRLLQRFTKHDDEPGRLGMLKAGSARARPDERNSTMLWTLVLVLLLLWLLGLITSYTFGGVIHILLVVALVVVVIRLLQGRRITT